MSNELSAPNSAPNDEIVIPNNKIVVPPGGIDTAVMDADNTFWDWIEMHLNGMNVMDKRLSHITGAPGSEIREDMKRVYADAGSFDYKPLSQQMDITLMWAMDMREEDRDKIRSILHPEDDSLESVTEDECAKLLKRLESKCFDPDNPPETAAEKLRLKLEGFRSSLIRHTDLSLAIHTTYTHERSKTFKLYPGVAESLKLLRENGIKTVIYSDSPASKVKRRALHFGIADDIDMICARDDTKVANEERGEEHLKHYEEVRRELGVYDVRAKIRNLTDDEVKPFGNLAKIFGRPEDVIKESVAVLGDNFDKDVGLAYNNGCYGFHAEYGTPSEDQVTGLYKFGGPTVVDRNAADNKINKERARIIQEMGKKKFIVVQDMREFVDFILEHNSRLSQ